MPDKKSEAVKNGIAERTWLKIAVAALLILATVLYLLRNTLLGMPTHACLKTRREGRTASTRDRDSHFQPHTVKKHCRLNGYWLRGSCVEACCKRLAKRCHGIIELFDARIDSDKPNAAN